MILKKREKKRKRERNLHMIIPSIILLEACLRNIYHNAKELTHSHTHNKNNKKEMDITLFVRELGKDTHKKERLLMYPWRSHA